MTTPPDPKRLIEVAFPLKEVSLDSVHEKNVRHGHISTLHIWPARRPLAASRAALITTLLPDPGNDVERREILHRMAGRVVEKVKTKRVNGRYVEEVKEETEGGILHWGRESGEDLEWFRKEIRKAYGGRAPKVLDPFAGGGAIPLEAMRLGCEVTAMDINPVAWFILKCTLEYPQRLAGQTRPLPAFALKDRDFMESFFKARGEKGTRLRASLERLGHTTKEGERVGPLVSDETTDQTTGEADLAWHVRAWGRWVLAQARRDLASRYPTYAEFTAIDRATSVAAPDTEPDAPRMILLEPDEDGVTHVEPLNAEYSEVYLKDSRNPRWIAKPTVAYLWARTVACKQCRATLPLLKTRWLCKKDNKRVLLTMEPDPDKAGVIFGVQADVPQTGGNAAQRREHDRRIGGGTMSRTGAACPCCRSIMTMEDIRLEGRAGRLGAVMTAVVVDGPQGKEYRLPTNHEGLMAKVSEEELQALYADIPFGLPEEPIIEDAKRNTWCVQYGLDSWHKLFTNRQLLALGEFRIITRHLFQALEDYSSLWREAIISNVVIANDRLSDYSSAICSWHKGKEQIRSTFARFALPVTWDFIEVNPLSDSSGGFLGTLDWVVRFIVHGLQASRFAATPNIKRLSAKSTFGEYDVIITDPPYYDAIGYSVLMDFFHVSLRRSTYGLSDEVELQFPERLGPKWDHDSEDGELVDDAKRFNGDKTRSRIAYEDGMAQAFQACHRTLKTDGRFVVVFANKHPNAWETLVGALIRAGFVVDGSWPIQTEMTTRARAMSSAALASSVWLVCRKRGAARPGWDNEVMPEMRQNVTKKLRDFWDAGIRGPDFVWAATGPALEAFSKHPVIRKANDESNEVMSVSEFLREVRRMVVDFVVGRVLTQGGEETVTGLDDVTTYYLLHRHDFGMDDAPVGGCILYALSCNLSDSALAGQHDLLTQSGGASSVDEPEDDAAGEDSGAEDDAESGGGAKMRLKPWSRRRGRNLGLEGPGGRPAPLIDQVHKLMHLWKAQDVARVNEYMDSRGLHQNALFRQILQALIELAPAGTEERALLERVSNHAASHEHVRRPSHGQLQMGGV